MAPNSLLSEFTCSDSMSFSEGNWDKFLGLTVLCQEDLECAYLPGEKLDLVQVSMPKAPKVSAYHTPRSCPAQSIHGVRDRPVLAL
jgi:hypothetical protein